MERFAEIVKGRTYLHRPNQSLNLYLTATLAIAVAVVIGLGFGHFKGKKNIQNDRPRRRIALFMCLEKYSAIGISAIETYAALYSKT